MANPETAKAIVERPIEELRETLQQTMGQSRSGAKRRISLESISSGCNRRGVDCFGGRGLTCDGPGEHGRTSQVGAAIQQFFGRNSPDEASAHTIGVD